MAELRIGHDQISLTIDSMRFNDGALIIKASGYGDPGRVPKITGDQPMVIVCDDGTIWGTMHQDCTENWKLARKNPESFINYDQRLECLGMTALKK